MVGEEYEALLQSALEDQAQHYEGEISRLYAELTAEQVDHNTMSAEEVRDVALLREEIDHLRRKIEETGRELLDMQAQEASHRATPQSLLREQQAAQDLPKSMQEECSKERAQNQTQVEELEQQIADLTANQRMMEQFSQNGELANAQIWGTGEASPSKNGKRGKKVRKNGRR